MNDRKFKAWSWTIAVVIVAAFWGYFFRSYFFS